MQHHKKYLIITIWVSVIAFVGAGFVGWGSYNMNPSKADAVATVGDEKIGFEEFNSKYNMLYNNYKLMDKNFSKEKAKLMGLDALVLNDLIVEKLFVNYAKTLGLAVSEDELLEKIASQQLFYKDGKFSKELYYELLKNNGYSSRSYEKMLKEELLTNKLFKALDMKVSKTEIAMLSSTTAMKDQLKIAAITVDDKQINIDEKELKALWEKTKANYKSKKSYLVQSYVFTPTISKDMEKLKAYYNKHKLSYAKLNGELLSFDEALSSLAVDMALQESKTPANKKYVELKKNKASFQKDQVYILGVDELPKGLVNAKEGEVLKPFIKDKAYVIVKLKKINPAKVLAYDEARMAVLDIYLQEKKKKLLIAKAQKTIKEGFTGLYTGFVDKASPKPGDISFLNQNEFSLLLARIFDTNKIDSYVLFPDKAVVYKIIDQKLPIIQDTLKTDSKNDYLMQNALQLKENIFKSELVSFLRTKYKITKYYKGV